MTSAFTQRPAPVQTRSRKTQQRIIEAATHLLVSAGWDDFTMANVAARAGVAVGSIYRRFENKEALFVAIHDAHLSRWKARADELLTAQAVEAQMSSEPVDTDREGPRALIEEVVRRYGQLFEEMGDLNGVVMLNVHKAPQVGPAGIEVMASVRETCLSLLGRYAPANSDLEIEICYRIAFSSYLEYATFGHYSQPHVRLDWSTLTAEVARACSTYLVAAQPTSTL